MRRFAVVPVVLFALCLIAPPVADASNFGRLFPGAPPFTAPTTQQLADLAQVQLDPNADADNNPTGIGSFETYFGQFADHDLTRDECCSVPLDPVDPTTIPNARTFQFDLDSVYGGGPAASPQLYAPDGLHLRVQDDNGNGVRDLPRNADGSAIIGDSRNDENEIISQVHEAFLRFHNFAVDHEPTCKAPAPPCFGKAQDTVRQYYQWIVLHDFLPTIVGQATIDRFLLPGNRVNCEFFCANTFTPVEFSVAAYRFGHSMVRKAYELNETTGKIQVFSFTQPDLRGGRPLPAGRQIAWGNFVNALTDPDDADGINVFRKIDILLSSGLFNLHIPGAEAAGSNVLGFRNMLRAKSYGLPSYETVAAAMGVTPVDTGARTFPGFTDGTPLWYGILAESARTTNGQTLGPVGGRIVAETFLRVLKDDPTSILNRPFRPRAPFAHRANTFTSADLLVDAGVATFPAGTVLDAMDDDNAVDDSVVDDGAAVDQG
jgi:hypothetical protein